MVMKAVMKAATIKLLACAIALFVLIPCIARAQNSPAPLPSKPMFYGFAMVDGYR